MQAYETGLNGSDARMVMSPKSDFFRFFGTPNGQPATSPRLRRLLPASP
jgi:membrane protease subunit HflC